MIFFIIVFACLNLCLGFALGMMFGYGPTPPAVWEQWFPWSEEPADNIEDASDEGEDDLDFFSNETNEPDVAGTVPEV